MRKDFLSTAGVAKLLGISRMSVVKKIWYGDIFALRIGRNYIVPVAKLPVRLAVRRGGRKRIIITPNLR